MGKIEVGFKEWLESRDEPIEGFVMGIGDTFYYDGVFTGSGANEEWAIALVPGIGAFCACDRCTGTYTGQDANSYGKYGYPHCMSSMDDPYGNQRLSEETLDRVYAAWSKANPDLAAEADLVSLRELVSHFLSRRIGFAELRKEAAKWNAFTQT